MKNIFQIEIPGQPQQKKSVQRDTRGKGHFYNPSERDMEIVKRLVKEHLPDGFEVIPKGVPVIVNFIYFFEPAKREKTKKFLDLIRNEDYPYMKKRDRDNTEKFYMDCMSKIVFYDDCQAYKGCSEKYYSENPRTIIEVIY